MRRPCVLSRPAAIGLSMGLLLWLAGCGSVPPQAPSAPDGRDGPAARVPEGLLAVPDAEPRLEPIRQGGPNKPYEVMGRRYVPITDDRPLREQGLASWYGRKFHGRRTANGEIYDMHAMTAAHPTLPLPSYARVRNPANQREVVVRINDRGPFHPGRIVDLSYTAALKLDLLRGVAPVELERITQDDIRTGAWRRGRDAQDTAVASRAPAASPEAAMAAAAPRRATAPARPAAAAAAPAAAMAPIPSAAPVVPQAPDAPQAPNAPQAPQAPQAPDAPAAPAVLADAEDPPPGPSRAVAPASTASVSPAFWVQLGAFRQREGAGSFQRRVAEALDWLAPLLGIHTEAGVHRLQAGPYASRDEAQGTAQRVREALQLVPVVVERR